MPAIDGLSLPAVRSLPTETLIVTDGFSCRHQITHGTDRRALHLAQVIEMAHREGPGGPTRRRPEDAVTAIPTA